jgi:thiamine-phosphate pyrophosphorylase
MTDERLGERLWEAMDRMPASAAIVYRHYGLGDAPRLALGQELAARAGQRGLLLAVAGSPKLASQLGAALVHNPVGPVDLPWSMAVHDRLEAMEANERGAALVFVGPVYPTRSHPGRAALGVPYAAELAGLAGCPAIALGGMDEARFVELEATCPGAFHGYAGIDCWLAD